MMKAGSALDLVEQAGRRARLAGLLGRLLLEEPGPDIADLVGAVPALRALGQRDPELAVEYERLFLRGVPVEESVFLGNDGQRGGPAAARLVDLYRNHDFDELDRWRVAGPDHLGLQLRCYAALCAQEATAWDDDRPDRATRTVEAERSMLAAHFGQWAEVAMAALARRSQDSPYSPLVDAVSAFVADEAERLRAAPDHPGMPAVQIEPAPDHLGSARLARWLLAPARCGGYLDTPDIAAVTAELGIPWRPSDPRSRLREVIESSVDGGDLSELVWRLRPVIEDWACQYARRETDRDGNRRSWRAWRLRADATLSLIDRLRLAPERAATNASGDIPGRIVVSGGDRSQRVLAGAQILERLGLLGLRASVSLDLPADVADEVGALIAAGADAAVLCGPDVTAIACGEAGDARAWEARHPAGAEVIVQLVAAAGPIRVNASRPATPWGRELDRALAGLTTSDESGDGRFRD